MSTSLEDLLRETMSARAADAPNVAGLVDHVRRGVGRRRRNNIVAVAVVAAASVVAVIMAVAVVVSAGGHHASTTATQPPITATTQPPASTTTTSTSTSPTTVPAGVSLRSVAWQAVAYPLAPDCRPNGVRVLKVDYPSPAPGVQLAAVLAQCNSGAGTPPVALYIYAGTTSSPRTPSLESTLIGSKERWQANSFSTNGGYLTMNVYGFSSNNVPDCCPDVRATLAWHWNGSSYELVGQEPAHVTLP